MVDDDVFKGYIDRLLGKWSASLTCLTSHGYWITVVFQLAQPVISLILLLTLNIQI